MKRINLKKNNYLIMLSASLSVILNDFYKLVLNKNFGQLKSAWTRCTQ